MKSTLLLILSLNILCSGYTQTTKFVDPSASGNMDGSSWVNAFTTIANALNNVTAGDTLLVKSGIYKESADIYQSLAIFGGCNGTESFSSEIDPSNNPTIFDADINNDDVLYNQTTKTDNLNYLIKIFATDSSNNFIFSGITFKNAFNSGAGAIYNGKGSALIISSQNYLPQTGPYYNTVVVRNCSFYGNMSDDAGGAMYVDGTHARWIATAIIDKCKFESNMSINSRAGAIFVYGYGSTESTGQAQITNCIFTENIDMSSDFPCVIYSGSSSTAGITRTVAINNTFYNNNAAATFVWNGSSNPGSIAQLTFKNNVVWNNNTGISSHYIANSSTAANTYQILIDHNNMDGPVTNAANSNVIISNTINSDPLFTATSTGDFSLQNTSTCINAGDTSQISGVYTDNYDYMLQNRFDGSAVDLGATEYQTPTGINEINKNSISIYPNPSFDLINISDKDVITRIELLNSNGQLVVSKNNNSSVFQLELPQETGIYLIRIYSGNTIYTHKVIKQ